MLILAAFLKTRHISYFSTYLSNIHPCEHIFEKNYLIIIPISTIFCRIGIFSECYNNFIGPLCRVCPSGFYMFNNIQCISCDTMIWNICRFIGIIFVLLIFLMVLVKSALDNTSLYDKLVNNSKISSKINTDSIDERVLRVKLDIQTIFIKILVNYLQIYSFLLLMPFNLVEIIDISFDFINSFISLPIKFLAFDCIIQESQILSKFPLTRLLFYNVLPFILLFFALVGYKTYYKIRRKRNINLIDRVYSTIFGVYFMIFPNILQESLKSL